jgi:hypothetical protein
VSFSDRPSISGKRRAGCVLYGLVSSVVVGFLFLLAALGHNECSYEPSLPGCEWDGVRRFLLFPGSLVAAIVGAILVARWAIRDDD